MAAVFSILIDCAVSPAQPLHLKVSYSAFDATFLPLWVAEERNIFKSLGLDLEISYGRGGSSTAQSLQSKSIDVAVIGGGPIEANLAGGDLIYIAAYVTTPVFTMFATPNIKSIEDLRGKNIGTTSAAAVTEYATILALKKNSLDPQKDVKIVYTGGMDNTLASLSKGLIQAGVLGGPAVIAARKAGFKEIVNFASLGIPFIHEGVSVRRAILQEQKEAIKRFMKGFVSGIRETKSDKPLSKRMIEKYLKLKDPEVVASGYDEIVPFMTTEPFVPKAAVQNLLSLIADRLPQAKTASAERFYDNGILDELKNEGFFK
jgi:NitT/TauT family transport system substrate-binding protein